MLQSIYIQNYALIDTLDISFTPGFLICANYTGVSFLNATPLPDAYTSRRRIHTSGPSSNSI